ncbi:MAG: TonB-dependent siderophore receptor [Salinibacter sp.]
MTVRLRPLFVALLLGMILVPTAHAQTGAIEGRVTSAESSEPLPGVNLRIEGTSKGAATDSTGRFAIESLDTGQYQIVATIVGYEEARSTVQVRSGEATQLNITLSRSTSELSEVVVVGGQADDYVSEVNTTALRFETSLTDIPQSIQSIGRGVIDDQAATFVADVTKNVSGVHRANGFGNTHDEFTIRGFDLRPIYKNGMRLVRDNGFTHVANIERVEVLKGPSSVLYGQVEPGGIVNIVTEKPLRQPHYSISLRGGSYETFRAYGDATGPIGGSDDVFYRFNAGYSNTGGFQRFYETERIFAAPSLRWDVGPETSLLVEAEGLIDRRPFWRGQVAVGDRPADIPVGRWLGEPWDQSETFFGLVRYEFNHQFSDNLRLRHAGSISAQDHFDLAARAAGLQDDGRTFNRTIFSSDTKKQNVYVQTELVGTTRTGHLGHQALLGVELSDQRSDVIGSLKETTPIDIFDPEYTVPEPDYPEDLNRVADFDDDSQNLGVYGHDLISLGPVKALVGGRYDLVNTFGTVRDPESDESAPGFVEQAFSPRGGLVYKPIATQSLYASYTTSFVPFFSGQFKLRDGSTPDPSRGEQLEIGLKSRWLDGRITSTLAAYDLRKTNVKTFEQNPETGEFFVLQTGEIASQGVEVDISGQATEGLRLVATYAFMDARVTKNETTPDQVGNQQVNAPRHAASLWSKYTVQSGAAQGLGIGAGVYYRGDRAGNLENNFTLPAYTRLDATVSYQYQRYELQLNVENVLDTRYYRNGNRRDRFTPGAPRTATISVKAQF